MNMFRTLLPLDDMAYPSKRYRIRYTIAKAMIAFWTKNKGTFFFFFFSLLDSQGCGSLTVTCTQASFFFLSQTANSNYKASREICNTCKGALNMKVSQEDGGDGNTYIKRKRHQESNGQLFDLYLMHVLSSKVQLS